MIDVDGRVAAFVDDQLAVHVVDLLKAERSLIEGLCLLKVLHREIGCRIAVFEHDGSPFSVGCSVGCRAGSRKME